MFTVDESGRITAVGVGSAALTVAGQDDSRFTGSCEITVADLKTLNLPAALDRIGAEAFAGVPAVQRVTVGADVQQIGSRAFAQMNSLAQVVFESESVAVSEDAFDGSDPLIVCSAGSAVASLAEAYGLKVLVD